MEIINTLPHHLSHPEVPYGPYVASKSLELGASIAPITKIYLDTKFWINLCDIKLGKLNNSDMCALLDLLAGLVASGRAICPLSMEIFREIFRQSDSNTLAVCANLIDQLSGGICLLDHFSRIEAEAFHFIRQTTKGLDHVYPLKQMVWTKSAYVLGHTTPIFTDATLTAGGADVAIQKAFFDQMWQMKLADFLEVSKGTFRMRDKSDISSLLNDGKFSNLKDNTSFQNLFLIELKGVLDACRPALAAVMQRVYQRDTGRTPTDQEIADNKSGDGLANLIYGAFRLEKISDQLPTVRIEAVLHAAVRWDSGRKYSRNDCADFRHAAAAVPYFDYFLTERSLSHLLSDGNLKLRKYFDCVVLQDAGRALSALALLEG